jgi:Ni,Fe-hydrogenase III small subunit/ferredoxin
MFGPIAEVLRRRTVTSGYPGKDEVAPHRFRGTPILVADRCRGHAACASVCPSDAIVVARSGPTDWTWRLDRARCVSCGACADVCPTQAIAIDRAFELAVRDRADLVTEVAFAVGAAPPPAAVPTPLAETALADRLAARTRALFRRSLHIRHLDVGSDNAADWELNALLNPYYDVQRLGIDFVASPRHADMVVITGAVTRNLAPALALTVEAMPEPRLIVAVGSDACGGGVAGTSYAAGGGVDNFLPVDVYIPGDPPRPYAILHGLLLALDRRQQTVQAERRRVVPGGPRAGTSAAIGVQFESNDRAGGHDGS